MAHFAPPKLVLLGTGGGPLPSPFRTGISQAIVVGEGVYLVDCGSDVTRQLRRARLLKNLRQVYLTHLHSDHDCDYFNLFLLGWPILQWNPPIDVYGPGPAGGRAALPDDGDIPLVAEEQPTPGVRALTDLHVRAHAYDLNIRMREAGRSDLRTMIVPHEIELPPDLGAAGPEHVAPPMKPTLVAEDADVRVTAVLVQHAPVFPAFAFRFETEKGSIVVSGDTAPCANLLTLAQGADVLVHEVFDDQTYEQWPDEPAGGTDASDKQEHHLVTSHTPLSQVGKVATEAGVGRLVLTHFVPGDDTKPDDHWIKGAEADYEGEIIVGKDLLELPL
ncbi:MAG: MBL fold metallo-hydrolase [Actinomycetota bacterium]|nr:MBL fold metallo-hydrolase [Actinomycetota bacterium]